MKCFQLRTAVGLGQSLGMVTLPQILGWLVADKVKVKSVGGVGSDGGMSSHIYLVNSSFCVKQPKAYSHVAKCLS